MDSGELTLLVTALANATAEGLSANEPGLLGAIFTQFGDTLSTIAAQKACLPEEKTACPKTS